MERIRGLMYEDWRMAMMEMCVKLPDRRCPFCDEVYEDTAEYVYIDLGYSQQVTPNYCENEECGAQEQGAYEYDSEHYEFAHGWVRPKYKNPDGSRDWSAGRLTPDDIMDVEPYEPDRRALN